MNTKKKDALVEAIEGIKPAEGRKLIIEETKSAKDSNGEQHWEVKVTEQTRMDEPVAYLFHVDKLAAIMASLDLTFIVGVQRDRVPVLFIV